LKGENCLTELKTLEFHLTWTGNLPSNFCFRCQVKKQLRDKSLGIVWQMWTDRLSYLFARSYQNTSFAIVRQLSGLKKKVQLGLWRTVKKKISFRSFWLELRDWGLNDLPATHERLAAVKSSADY
jgi:hypothetical protein